MHVEISRGLDHEPIEGFYSEAEAVELVREVLADAASFMAMVITISESKPVRNQDVLANPGLVPDDHDSFSICVMRGKTFRVNRRMESERWFEMSQNRPLVESDVLDVVRSVYQGDSAWRSGFELSRRELSVDHGERIALLRSYEANRSQTEARHLRLAPWRSAIWTSLAVAVLLTVWWWIRGR